VAVQRLEVGEAIRDPQARDGHDAREVAAILPLRSWVHARVVFVDECIESQSDVS
jgi:hypothetical protein